MLKQKITGSVQEVILPDFPDDDDNTVTTTVTKSRRVSFGPNFVKEFIVDSAISAQCMAEYEQPFPSSDSSNADSSHSAISHGTFVLQENVKVHKIDSDTAENRPKPPKFASTICFSADSPTADMEFTEGCITLAKSILDKKNKEMTVFIQAKPKGPKEEEKTKEEETNYFEGSQFEMSMTQCLKSKEKRFEKTKIFGKYEDEMSMTRCERFFEDEDEDESKENRMPLDAIMRYLDRDESDSDLFNPEKSFTQLLGVNNSVELSDASEQLNLNESMEISGDLNVPVGRRSTEMPSGGPSENEPVRRLSSDDEMEAAEQQERSEETKSGCLDVSEHPMRFSEEASSEEMAVEDMTDDEEVVSEKVRTEEMVSGQLIAEELGSEEEASEKMIVEEMIVEKMVLQKVVTEEMTSEMMVIEETSAKKKIRTEEMLVKTPEEMVREKVADEDVIGERITEEIVAEKMPSAEKILTGTRTEEMSGEKITPEKITSEKMEAQEKIPENILPEKILTEERAAKKTRTEEMVDEEMTREKITTENMISEKMVSQKVTPEKMVTQAKVPEKMPPEKMITEEMIAENMVTQEKTPEKIPSEKLIPEEREGMKTKTGKMVSGEMLGEKMTTEEVVTGKIAEEIVAEKMPLEKIIPEETVAEKITPEKMVTEEIVAEKITAENMVIHEKTPEKMLSENITTENMVTQGKTPEKMPFEKLTSEERPTKQTRTDILAEKTTPEKMVPEEMAREKITAEETSPEDTITEDLMDMEPPWNPPPFVRKTTPAVSQQFIPQEDDSPREPSLGDLKVIESLKEQAKEKGCEWSLRDVQHPRKRSQGLISFSCSLLDSTTSLRFSLKMSGEDALDSCSLVTDSSILLDEERGCRLPEYTLAVGFGFDELRKYFGALQGVATLRHVPYYMDRVNSFLSKMNAYLRQIHAILTSYPGSRLSGCRLSFRLFSFPMFCSCVVSIDLSNVFRLSRASLLFSHDFGCLDERKVGEIFEESLKGENSLCEFVVKSTRYLVELERQSGYLSKRKHIRLLPDELKS